MKRIFALAVITFKEGVRSRAVYGIGLFSSSFWVSILP